MMLTFKKFEQRRSCESWETNRVRNVYSNDSDPS